MNELVCDRIEEDTVILIDENGTCHHYPLSSFQTPPKEGDVFDSALVFDPIKTKERKESAASLLRKLSKKGKK